MRSTSKEMYSPQAFAHFVKVKYTIKKKIL